MKNLKSKLGYVLIIVATLVFVSCTGDEGPMGPAGADGINGINGVNGQDGKDGKDGNANVIASGWITNPVYGKEGLGTSFPLSTNRSHFNETVRDSGLIMVYGKTSSLRTVALPITWSRTILYSFSVSSQALKIIISSSVASRNIKYDNFTHFRYVVVPATTASTKAKKELKNMGYAQAMDFLKLEH